MDAADLIALLPLIVVAASAVVVLLAIALRRDRRVSALLAALGLLAALACLPLAAREAPRTVTALLVVDGFALLIAGLMFAAALITVVLVHACPVRGAARGDEFHVLVLVAALGAAVLGASRHFAALFLGVELIGVALFALVPYARDDARALEAGVKYLVLSGAASALLLFGIALIYAAEGTLVFTPAGDGSATPWRLAGHALLIAGIGFKLSLVPFHLWTPDVYQGAPAPVTGFLAALSKGAVFAALLRYAGAAGLLDEAAMTLALALLAAASMLAGNLLALLQDDLKRLLAYSSIAHLGYLMVALLAAGPFGAEAAGYYLAAYMVTTLAAFAVITVHSAGVDEHESAHELTRLAGYAGLFWRRPWLAAVFTTALLSLAGIPLTMGFVAKFYLFAAGAAEGLWALLAVLVVASVLGLFYYLRVVATLFAPVPKDVPAARAAGGLAGAAVLAALAAAMLGLGVLPQALIEFARAAALTLH